MATSSTPLLYPPPSIDLLKSLYLHKPLTELPTPSAILDLALVRRNCDRMLDTCEALGVGFRAHVKTHKTVELTRYQLLGSKTTRPPAPPTGTAINTGKVCVSTIAEAEGLIPLVEEGIVTDILYAFPLPTSAVARLHKSLRVPYPDLKISILIDNYQQLSYFFDYIQEQDIPASEGEYGIFIKLDAGYHRCGVHVTETHDLDNLVQLARNLADVGALSFKGIYTHSGNSYSSAQPDDAVWLIVEEMEIALQALEFDTDGEAAQTPVVISVGASPTAIVLENYRYMTDPGTSTAFSMLDELLTRIKNRPRISLEIHAGVYSTLDLQQISTNVLTPPLTHKLTSIGITILAEVASIYDRRNEALVNVGVTGLGREPGKKTGEWESVWGVMSDWDDERPTTGMCLDEGGWVVKKLSQEHGILGWKSERDARRPVLRIGKKVRIFPQHSCIAGAGHGWYFVVDSDDGAEGGSVVKDIWVRWRGW